LREPDPDPVAQIPLASSGANTVVRILSAMVLAPVAIGVVWAGGWTFAMFWLLAGAAVLWEWSNIVMGARELSPMRRGGWLIAGFGYAAVLVLAPALLRSDAQFGIHAILFLFAVVWTTDILGYFGGRAIGGTKLAPSVSPSKTWSGAVCGLIGAAIAAAATAYFVSGMRSLALIIVGVLLSVVSQLGDLGESAFKRKFQTKDASHLIPGHGGVMDRLDGFWAAALVAALIGIARSGFAEPARGLLVW
jgi:phosphatidate cytidylyltransferase